jgi:hypothetical protein
LEAGILKALEKIVLVCLFMLLLSFKMTAEETIPEMVTRVSCDIGIDPKIAFALLKEENEKHDVFADNYNLLSDSHDLGLFQLNSRYIHTDFIPRYWHSERPFDVFDAESNTFVALSHLKYLLCRFDSNILDAVRAYNGGETAVISNTLKQKTIDYSYRIMETVECMID